MPSMGGVPIFLSAIITLLIFLPAYQIQNIRFIIGAAFLIFILGLRDDLLPLKPQYKLISQLIPAIIIIYNRDFLLKNFNGLFFLYNLPPSISILITVVFIIYITNTINLIDGIDGLAASLTFIILSFLNTAFLLNQDYLYLLLSLSFTWSIIAFMYFNWHPAKIFMGDTGALLLGFIIAILALRFINIDKIFESKISLTIAILAVPLYDTIRTFVNRISKGTSPFYPDKTHIHHLLLRTGMNHEKATIILIGLQLIIIIIAILIDGFGENIVFLAIFVIILTFNFWLEKKINKKIKKKHLSNSKPKT